jgi:hypothetical protein
MPMRAPGRAVWQGATPAVARRPGPLRPRPVGARDVGGLPTVARARGVASALLTADTTVNLREETDMKRLVGAALALVLTAGGAWAAEIEGKIQSVDQGDRVIVLEDGTKLWVAEGTPMDGLKEGAKVKASYEERDGKNVTTTVTVSE